MRYGHGRRLSPEIGLDFSVNTGGGSRAQIYIARYAYAGVGARGNVMSRVFSNRIWG